MKEHKNEGLNVSKKETRDKKTSLFHPLFSSTLFNNKAFTLPEIMVAAAVGAVVILGAATVSNYALQMVTEIVRQNEVEETFLSAEYDLRQIFSQAVNVQVEDNNIIDISPASGQVVGGPGPYNSLTFGAQDGTIDTLGVFPREMGGAGRGGATEIRSYFMATGLFFRRPNLTGPCANVTIYTNLIQNNCSGAIIIDPGHYDDLSVHGNSTDMSVSATSNRVRIYPHIVSLEMSANRLGNPYVQSVSFVVTYRYFLNGTANYTFITPMPAGSSTRFRDKRQIIEITLRNNYVGQSLLADGYPVRPFENLYFFPAAGLRGR